MSARACRWLVGMGLWACLVGRATAAPHFLFLDFPDATADYETDLCKGPVTPVDWTKYGVSRDVAIEELYCRVQGYFMKYNVSVVHERVTVAHASVIVGETVTCPALPAGWATFSPLDCDNKVEDDFAFVQTGGPLPRTIECLSLAIARVAANRYGLSDVMSDTDIMGSGGAAAACAGSRSFVDASFSVTLGSCGASTQNSHQLLVKNVGLWEGGAKSCDASSSDAGATDSGPGDDRDAPSASDRPGGDTASRKESGGCGCREAGADPVTGPPAALLLVLMARGARRRSVRGRGPGAPGVDTFGSRHFEQLLSYAEAAGGARWTRRRSSRST